MLSDYEVIYRNVLAASHDYGVTLRMLIPLIVCILFSFCYRDNFVGRWLSIWGGTTKYSSSFVATFLNAMEQS